MKILVLEDDPVSMKSLTIDIEALGHVALEALNAVQAFSMLRNHADIDLIITDLRLPHEKGTSFIKDVREFFHDKPIIVVSGTVDKKQLLLIKKYNCMDILVKPHDKNRLKALIDSIK